MAVFAILIIILAAVEINVMLRKKLKRELALFCILTVCGFALGMFYLSEPYRTGLSLQILNLLF